MPTIQELESGQVTQGYQEPTTFYQITDKETGEIKKIPMLQKHNVTALCDNILKLNEKAQYVSILLSGKSSSGKTTLAQTIIHRISCENKNNQRYIIKWFSGKDLHRLDELINGLEQGFNYILVLDDVSFVLDQAPPKKRKELAEALTTIRHKVKGKVITFINVHYGRAILPIFRDSYFRILTSMSSEDSRNWKESFGWDNQYQIDKFQKQFSSQMQNSYFYINIGESKSYCYKTDEPFRISLVSDMSGVHPMLFPAEGCPTCSPLNKANNKQKISSERFFEEFEKTYTNRAKPALQYFLYFVQGKTDALPSDKQRAVRFLQKMLNKYDLSIQELTELAISEKKLNRKRRYTHHDQELELENKIVQNA